MQTEMHSGGGVLCKIQNVKLTQIIFRNTDDEQADLVKY
jgi:hypothetical protein